MKDIFTWKNEVQSIQKYIGEKYDCTVWGLSNDNYTRLQLPWARVIIEKFTDRIIPIISGGTMTKAFQSHLDQWVRQTVEFGNASIIVSENGDIRIPSPLTSLAQKTVGDTVLFYEDLGENGEIYSWDGDLYWRFKDSDESYPIEGSQIFTLFYGDSNLKPYGESRLSPSIRNQITWASRIQAYIESVGYNQSHTQLILTNLQTEIMNEYSEGRTKSAEDLKAIRTGIHQILGFGVSDDNSEVRATVVDPTDPSGLIKIFERVAANIATAVNLEPREFGNTAAVAPSAEAQYAAKEDLVLEVNKFTKKIHRDVLSALVAVAEAFGEQDPVLRWANAATPSESSMMDALVKFISVFPEARFSRAAHLKYGIDPEISDDILGFGGGTPEIQAVPSE